MNNPHNTLRRLGEALATAVHQDELPEEGGFDLAAGLFGHHVSDWLRAVAAEIDRIGAETTAAAINASGIEQENRELRRAWCIAYAGLAAYMDDGEAQDSRALPTIDFMRDSIATIRAKMLKRASAYYAPAGADDVGKASYDVANHEDVLLAMKCGAVSYTRPPIRAVRGLSFTFDQLHEFLRLVGIQREQQVARRIASIIDDCRVLSARIEEEKNRLAEALVAYQNAGIGDTTDYRKQLEAYDLAVEALAGYAVNTTESI